jgi:hypothetical protein
MKGSPVRVRASALSSEHGFAVGKAPLLYQAVLIEWDDEPFAQKRFIVWTASPDRAGAFALEWLDYVERIGVNRDTDVQAVPLDMRLEEAELTAFSPSWGDVQNLTGRPAARMRDLLGLRGSWRRARIIWDRDAPNSLGSHIV